jgi:hypothetical protein
LRSEDVALVILALMSLAVFGGLAILWMAMTNRRALREMEHRERLAMIQRGLIPAPEVDPLGFEEAMGELSTGSPNADRWRTAGVTFIGLGLGLMMLIGFAAGEPGVGLGIGGGFAVLGATLLLNGLPSRRPDVSRYRATPQAPQRPMRPTPSPPPEPPIQ